MVEEVGAGEGCLDVPKEGVGGPLPPPLPPPPLFIDSNVETDTDVEMGDDADDGLCFSSEDGAS